MIFNSVTKLSDKTEKGFFVEKIKIYIRLVEVYAEKNFIDTNDIIGVNDISLIEELIDIGVIEDEENISELKRIVGISDFGKFINAVKFHIKHKNEMGWHLNKLYNSYRKEVQEKSKQDNSPKLVDFFCGAGGLSLGFLQEGFNVKLANDIENVCIETYRYNHPELPSDKLIQGDIREIVNNVENYIDEDIDIVVGGPPCQGFSSANQQRIIDDPRNELYKYFIKAVEKIAPKFVVMENVKGMMKVAEQVVEDYMSLRIEKEGNLLSYNVAYKLLNSNDFSVAQSRERLIYIAVRSDIQEKFNITPEFIFEEIGVSVSNNKKFVLMDALENIKPLDAPRIKNMNEVDDEKTGKKIDTNEYDGDENDYLKLINKERKIPFVYNHKARFCNDINYEIYKRLDQGNDATDPKIADIMPYSHRNHVFKDKYYKLIADKPSRTITAHLRMDCHSHIHPFQVRSITPREAARIQSFPDDYLFMGAYLKTYMQIGNAVPPMMARGIAKVIKKYIE